MLAMSEALGMRVIAEGIETTEQRAQLIQLGCTLGQGYLFASPLSSSAMTHLLDGDGRREPAVA
jgi:EAL domain-containing protein (putative c-di-GMP-specific phosphodiesterase class I)